MSRDKFASNVCEKALTVADSDNRHMLIEEMITARHDGVSSVLYMVDDQYASLYFESSCRPYINTHSLDYVLQRALSFAEGEQKQIMSDILRPRLARMRKFSSHDKHLIASTWVRGLFYVYDIGLTSDFYSSTASRSRSMHPFRGYRGLSPFPQ